MSGETTHYNPLRAKRPGAQAQQGREYVDDIIRQSEADCDFCRAENFTVSQDRERERERGTKITKCLAGR